VTLVKFLDTIEALLYITKAAKTQHCSPAGPCPIELIAQNYSHSTHVKDLTENTRPMQAAQVAEKMTSTSNLLIFCTAVRSSLQQASFGMAAIGTHQCE